MVLLAVLLLLGGFWHGGSATSSPAVSAANFYPAASGSGGLSMPVSTGGAVGTVSASNTTSSTTWSITGGNSAGDFQIASPGTGGAITFTSTGQSDYNGNTNSKTATLTVQACNGASCGSNSNIVITAYADGSVNASTATSAQYPSLLSGYGSTPPWQVAGVGYYVGPQSSCSSFTDPNTISTTANYTVVRSNTNGGSSVIGNYITVTGDNQTFNCYDFSLHGGWQIDVQGNGCTITNNNFVQQSTAQQPILFEGTAQGGTVKYNTINGNSTNDITGNAVAQIFIVGNIGTFTVEYNYIYNTWSRPIDYGGQASGLTQTDTIKYNLIVNTGISTVQHGDFVFSNSTNGGTINLTHDFNTIYQPNAPAGGGAQGIVAFAHGGSNPTFNSPDISYNALVTITPSPPLTGSNEGVDPMMHLGTTEINGVGTVQYNYLDPSGNLAAGGSPGLYLSNDTTAGNLNGTITCSGNVNMLNGSAVTSASGGGQTCN